MVYRCGITGESASDIPNFSSPRFCAGLVKTCTPGWATLRSRAFETKTETEIEYEYPGRCDERPGYTAYVAKTPRARGPDQIDTKNGRGREGLDEIYRQRI